MFKFFKNIYQELYAWFLYSTDVDLLSFGLSYLVMVFLELLNILCLIIFTQKLLSIALIEFLLTQKVSIAIFLLIVLAGNYFFLSGIWRRGERAKDFNNRAFGYIAVSLILGVVAYLFRPTA